jgi:serine/threonine protein kinase
MIGVDNRVRICDFGIAAKIRKGESAIEESAGSRAYMAPEVWNS